MREPVICAWDYPTLTVFGEGNSSIHGERYHYIRYNDGTEEFYDLTSDPMEWNNLITRLTPQQASEKTRLAALIPAELASGITRTDNKYKKSARVINESIKATRPLSTLK